MVTTRDVPVVEAIKQEPKSSGTSVLLDPEKASFESPSGIKPGLTRQQRLSIMATTAVFFNTWGLMLGFGALQTYYEEVLLVTYTSSEISWISSTAIFLLLGSGLASGPIYDRGYFKLLFITGALLEIFGLMMLSLSTKYYQAFLAQGICVGLGTGMLYVPSIASTMGILDAPRRPKIMSLIAVASGVGGVIYPIVIRQLISEVGFPWAVRIMGFIVLTVYGTTAGNLTSGHRRDTSGSSSARPWIDVSAFTDVPFVLASLMAVFASLSYFVPLTFLPLFAESGAVAGFSDHDRDLAFDLIAIVNGASIVGRVAAGLIALRFGALETLTAGVFGSALVLFCWCAVSSLSGLVVWCVFWGLLSSVVIALPGAIVPLLTSDMRLLGTRNGMYWVAGGVGTLVGSPIGGALLAATGPEGGLRWWPLQVFTALGMVAATLSGVPVVIHLRSKRKLSG